MPKYHDIDVDVIVIGAGLSGLSAAQYILEKLPTLDVLVLEASDRIGGRVHSVPLYVSQNQYSSYDLGGQWISRSQKHIVDLVEKYNFQLVLHEKHGKIVGETPSGMIFTSFKDPPTFGRIIDDMVVHKFYAKLEKLVEKITFNNYAWIREWEILDAMSMENFILENVGNMIFREMVRHVVRASCGSEPKNISVLFYLIYCIGSRNLVSKFLSSTGGWREAWIKGGAEQIIYALAQDISWSNIRLSETVTAIEDTENYIKVSTIHEAYYCSYVILAVPPNQILKLNFDPPLLDKHVESLKNIINGHLIKFIVTYENAFWKQSGFSGDIVSCGVGPIHLCYDASADNKPALCGYIFYFYYMEHINDLYKKSSQLHTKQNDIFKSQVLKQLSNYFGEEALKPLSYTEKSWGNEQFAGGCPRCSSMIGHTKVYSQLGTSHGRIYWAGSETADEWNGFMEGAVIAGQRAAVQVIYDTRPAAITAQDIFKVTGLNGFLKGCPGGRIERSVAFRIDKMNPKAQTNFVTKREAKNYYTKDIIKTPKELTSHCKQNVRSQTKTIFNPKLEKLPEETSVSSSSTCGSLTENADKIAGRVLTKSDVSRRRRRRNTIKAPQNVQNEDVCDEGLPEDSFVHKALGWWKVMVPVAVLSVAGVVAMLSVAQASTTAGTAVALETDIMT